MLESHQISTLKSLLETPKRISIIPHRNVDGDAMGSTLGLYNILKQLNHQVTVVVPNDIPEYLKWLPGTDNTIVFEGNETNNATRILEESELIFTLDFNALHRTGEQMERVLKTLPATFVMIDHHEKPDTYAAFTFSSTTYGSTCQMVYDFIQDLNLSHYINKDVANC